MKTTARLLYLFLVASLVLIPALSISVHGSSPAQTSIFYFHKQSSKTINAVTTSLWSNTTSLWSPSTQIEQRDLSGGPAVFNFYGQPVLAGNVTIQGYVNFTLYLQASSSTGGGTVITASLGEVNSTGANVFVASATLNGPVHTVLQSYLLSSSAGPLQVTAGSILNFTITVTAPGSTAQLFMYYDSPSSPSSNSVDFQSRLGFSSSETYDSTGVLRSAFNKNLTSTSREVTLQAQAFDALGLYDIISVKTNITSPTGSPYSTNARLERIKGSDMSNAGTWELNVTYWNTDPSGVYQIAVVAIDNSGIVATSRLSYSLYATWLLTIRAVQSDSSQTPVPGVQVAVFTSGNPVYFGISNSTGYVVPLAILPDNSTYTVDSYWNGILVNQTNLFRPSSISFSIIIPLYQVDFSKSFFDASGDTLYTPPSSFHLVYPDGSYTEPSPTGVDSLPAGTYTVSSVIWDGVDVTPSTTVVDPSYGNPVFILRIYELNARVVDQSNHPVEGAHVILFLNGVVLAQGMTDSNGTILVHDLPKGQFVVIAKSAGQTDYGRAEISLGSNTSVEVQLPLAAVEYSIITSIVVWVIVGIALVASASSGIIWYRRVSKNRSSRDRKGPESKASTRPDVL